MKLETNLHAPITKRRVTNLRLQDKESNVNGRLHPSEWSFCSKTRKKRRLAALLAVGGMYAVLRTDNSGRDYSVGIGRKLVAGRILSALTRICDYGLL